MASGSAAVWGAAAVGTLRLDLVLLPGENFALGLKNTLASKDRFPPFRDLVLDRSGRTEGEQGVANPVLMYGHPKPCARMLAGEPCGRNLETAVQSILGYSSKAWKHGECSNCQRRKPKAPVTPPVQPPHLPHAVGHGACACHVSPYLCTIPGQVTPSAPTGQGGKHKSKRRRGEAGDGSSEVTHACRRPRLRLSPPPCSALLLPAPPAPTPASLRQPSRAVAGGGRGTTGGRRG